MAPGSEEVSARRIIACFAPGSAAAPQALAALVKDMQSELLGLFIEDVELLRFAALPFAAEIGLASGTRRALDPAAMELTLRIQASRLRQALAAALEPNATWSFRVARASPADALAAALAEGLSPCLVIPPGADPRASRAVLRVSRSTGAELRALLASARPVLVVRE